MIAKKLEIFDFRNIAEAVIDFSPGVNVLVGDNAQGKTNALEALYLFAEGKSFRAKSERELIRFTTPMAGVRLTMESARREEQLVMEYAQDEGRDTVRRTARRNMIAQRRIGEMLGIFRAVLFCPEHLQLVKGGPGERRSFLDIALSQLRPVYLKSLQKFYAVLAERNRLLKDARDNRAAYDATNELWARQLADCAGYVTAARDSYVRELDALARENFAEMTAGRETPALTYRPSAGAELDSSDAAAVAERYFSLYTTAGDREILAGATLWGVHRDDVAITLDGREARLYASQGQDRSIALALKLAEGALSEKVSGESPVYLFDDVMSELDSSRRDFLLQRFSGRQIIITSCEPDFFRGKAARVIRVEAGCYTPV